MSKQFAVNLLGRFTVYSDMKPLALPPSCQRVVALAALKRRPIHRQWVCATLWPDSPLAKSAASLRSSLWRLRPLGADPLLSVGPQHIELAPDVSVDWHAAVDLIERLLDGGQPAPELIPLLRAGGLLDGWGDRWSAGERRRYRALRTAALEALGRNSQKQVAHYACRSPYGAHTLGTVRKTSNDSRDR